jgi:flagellin-specific chaperone FliS
MLQEAHKALEAMSAACTAMKDDDWGEAERNLQQVQDTVGRLLREVGEKSREAMMVPNPEKGDRG